MISWKGLWPFVAGLLLLHLALALWPNGPLSLATNVVLLAANLYVLFCASVVLRDQGLAGVGLFAAGYLVLYLLLVVLLERESLFILLVILYASVYRIPLLLMLFVAFVLSYVVLQPYAFESFCVLGLSVFIVWRLREKGASRFIVGCAAASLLCLGLILLPVLHLMVQDSPQTLVSAAARPEVQSAIVLSLLSSALAMLIVTLFGVPLAYVLARGAPRGRELIEALIDLPILIPQSVAGLALLALLGPGSSLGQALQNLGITMAGRFVGLVLAQVFVASPFLIKAAVSAFEAVPEHLEGAARTLGASPRRTFFQVAVPLAGRGIFMGMTLAWARAISEFGAILLFAPHPLTAPILVHNEFLKAGLSESRPIAVVLLVSCLWIFVLLQFGKTFLPTMARASARRSAT